MVHPGRGRYYKLKMTRIPRLVENFPQKNHHSKYVRVATTAIKNVGLREPRSAVVCLACSPTF